MTMYNNSSDADDRAERQKQYEEDRIRKEKEEEVHRKEDARREIQRKMDLLQLDINHVTTRMQTLKGVLQHLETEARREEEKEVRDDRELDRMKRDLVSKKGQVRVLEDKIRDAEAHKGGGGSKQHEADEKRNEYDKLEKEYSDLDHQMMRYDSELRNLR